MNKIFLFTFALILTACATPAQQTVEVPPEPTSTTQPTVTLKPTHTPVPTKTSTATPTPYEFSDKFYIDREMFAHIRGWPLKESLNGGYLSVRGEIDQNSIRKVKFSYGDITILRVVDFYYMDINDTIQILSLPLAGYNASTDEFFSIGQVNTTQGLGMPGEPYIDGGISDFFTSRNEYAEANGGAVLTDLNFGKTKDKSTWPTFFVTSLDEQGTLSQSFIEQGNPEAFPDFPQAQNLTIPSTIMVFIASN